MTSSWARAIVFYRCGNGSSIGYFESSAITACILKGKEKPVMKWSFLTKVENKDLKSFLQALSAFGVDQWAKELGIQDNKLIIKLQGK